jgi:HAD superfamily hydrolase (TIGR01484 family)
MNILALDIDGTLIPSKSTLSDLAKGLFDISKYSQEKNFAIALVTGRSMNEIFMDNYLIEILDPIFIITNCGMEIFRKNEPHKRELCLKYNYYLNQSDTAELDDCVNYLIEFNPNIFSQDSKKQFKYKKSYFINNGDLGALKKELLLANNLFPNIDVLVSFNESSMHFLDIQHKNSTKFGALKFLIDNGKLTDVFFFGDNGNDIPCINNLPNSFLFGNFKDEIEFFYGRQRSGCFIYEDSGPEAILKTLKSYLN